MLARARRRSPPGHEHPARSVSAPNPRAAGVAAAPGAAATPNLRGNPDSSHCNDASPSVASRITEIDYDETSQKARQRAPPPASRVRVSGVQRFRLLCRPRPVKEQALRHVAKRPGTARDEVWDPYVDLGGGGRGLAARLRACGGAVALEVDRRPSAPPGHAKSCRRSLTQTCDPTLNTYDTASSGPTRIS